MLQNASKTVLSVFSLLNRSGRKFKIICNLNLVQIYYSKRKYILKFKLSFIVKYYRVDPNIHCKMPFGWDCRGDLNAGWLPRPFRGDPCQESHQLAFQVKMRAHALPHLAD